MCIWLEIIASEADYNHSVYIHLICLIASQYAWSWLSYWKLENVQVIRITWIIHISTKSYGYRQVEY